MLNFAYGSIRNRWNNTGYFEINRNSLNLIQKLLYMTFKGEWTRARERRERQARQEHVGTREQLHCPFPF